MQPAAHIRLAEGRVEMFKHARALGSAHAHALFDRLVVTRNGGADEPARDFSAYSVLFGGQPIDVGASLQAAPGVTLTRRC
jgi:CRISPR-associated protein Csd2